MLKYSFTSPQGDTYEVEGPDGSSREEAFNILQEGIKNGYYKPVGKQEQSKPCLLYTSPSPRDA